MAPPSGPGQVSLKCEGEAAEACNEAIGAVSETNVSSSSSPSSSSSEVYVNISALAELDLTPSGGVSDAKGFTVVDDVSLPPSLALRSSPRETGRRRRSYCRRAHRPLRAWASWQGGEEGTSGAARSVPFWACAVRSDSEVGVRFFALHLPEASLVRGSVGPGGGLGFSAPPAYSCPRGSP